VDPSAGSIPFYFPCNGKLVRTAIGAHPPPHTHTRVLLTRTLTGGPAAQLGWVDKLVNHGLKRTASLAPLVVRGIPSIQEP
jgi:hypothetical protein